MLATEQSRPRYSSGVLSLKEEGFGLSILEAEDFAVTTDVELALELSHAMSAHCSIQISCGHHLRPFAPSSISIQLFKESSRHRCFLVLKHKDDSHVVWFLCSFFPLPSVSSISHPTSTDFMEETDLARVDFGAAKGIVVGTHLG